MEVGGTVGVVVSVADSVDVVSLDIVIGAVEVTVCVGVGRGIAELFITVAHVVLVGIEVLGVVVGDTVGSRLRAVVELIAIGMGVGEAGSFTEDDELYGFGNACGGMLSSFISPVVFGVSGAQSSPQNDPDAYSSAALATSWSSSHSP